MTAYMQHVALHALQKLGLPVREIGKRPEFGPDVHDAAGASSEELVMARTRHGRRVMTALVGWREEREERLLGVYVYEFGGRGDDDSIVNTDVEWRVIMQPTEANFEPCAALSFPFATPLLASTPPFFLFSLF